MRRYLHAFFVALQMTLRGETPPPAPDEPLQDWVAGALSRLDQVDALAAQHKLDPADVILHIDKRDTSMVLILRIVRHHMTEAYPRLLRQPSTQSLTLLRATNMDDHFRLTRLENAPELAGTPVQQAVAALTAHLGAVPTHESKS